MLYNIKTLNVGLALKDEYLKIRMSRGSIFLSDLQQNFVGVLRPPLIHTSVQVLDMVMHMPDMSA